MTQADNIGSMSVIPWSGNDTAGNARRGIVEIKTSTFVVSEHDTDGIINQAIAQAKHGMDLDNKKQFTMEEITQITAAAGATLWVASSKGLSALYRLAFTVRQNGWYLSSVELFSDPDKPVTETNMELAWRLWVDQVLVDTGRQGQGKWRVQADLVTYIPAICALPTKMITTKITKTGDVSAHVQIGDSVEFDIDDIRAEKVPVPLAKLKKINDLGDGESVEIAEEVGPETFIRQTSLIREIGSYATYVDPNSADAEELLALTRATTAGIRKHVKNPSYSGSDEAKLPMKLRTRGAQRELIAYPDSEHNEAWAVNALRPKFKLEVEVDGG